MKRLLTFIAVALLLLLFLAAPVVGADKKKKGGEEEKGADEAGEAKGKSEFVCEADVFYTWKRTPEPPEPPESGENSASGKQPGREEPPASPPQPEIPTDPIEVFHTRGGERGSEQQAVHDKLMERLPKLQSEARGVCEQTHQSKSICVAHHLRTMQRVYRSLDFPARKEYLDSVSADCSRHVGVCLSARTGEIKCHEEKLPGAAPKKAAEGKKEGKEKKKK